MMRRAGGGVALAALVGLVALLAGCAGGPASAQPSAPTSSASRTAPASPSASDRASTVADHVSKVLVVVLENHSQEEARAQMPHLAAFADRYGYADSWYAVAHPSLPNYLELAGGSTFGIGDDHGPRHHPLSGPSVFGQLISQGHTAATYAEGMTTPCEQNNDGRYAVRHNPWAYFTDPGERSACNQFDVPSGTPASGELHDAVAAGALPAYSLLVPDTCNDAHNCSLAAADGWLGDWLSVLEAGPDFTSGRLAVVVTFDEDDHHAGNHVFTAVGAAQLHGQVVSTQFTHASLAAVPSRLAGLPPLRDAQGSPDVLQAFGLG
jgi:phosphatidylinositol-3-phosphatase